MIDGPHTFTLNAPQEPSPGASARTACERCGTFAELRDYDAQQICDECLNRLSEIERTAPTVGNLVSGSAWVMGRIGILAAFILAVSDLPIVLVEVFAPESPSFLSTAWGATVSILAQGAVFHLAQRAIRGEDLSLGASVQRSVATAGKLISANFFAGLQIFFYLLLLIVPGIVRGLSLVLVLPIALHEQASGTVACTRSAERMKGHRWTALAAYAVWGFVWMTGLALYVGFTLALETSALDDVPLWVVNGALLGSGVLLPLLMLPVMCTTAVLYAKTLKYRIY